jgi:hypothetical protein
MEHQHLSKTEGPSMRDILFVSSNPDGTMGQNVSCNPVATSGKANIIRESSLLPSIGSVVGQSVGAVSDESGGNWAVRLGSTEAKRFVKWLDAVAYFKEYEREGWVPCGLNIFDRANGWEMWPLSGAKVGANAEGSR